MGRALLIIYFVAQPKMLTTCPGQMMFALGQVNASGNNINKQCAFQLENCSSVKELCVHSRENLYPASKVASIDLYFYRKIKGHSVGRVENTLTD